MSMYSLESFLYREVNRASRERDSSKVANLGAYAFLLAKILQKFNPTINCGQEYVFSKRAPGFIVYRGLSIDKNELDQYN